MNNWYIKKSKDSFEYSYYKIYHCGSWQYIIYSDSCEGSKQKLQEWNTGCRICKEPVPDSIIFQLGLLAK